MNRRDVTAKLTEAAMVYLCHRKQAVFREIGCLRRGKLRADVVGVTLRGIVSIVEVKSCWQDFAADRKLDQYRQYCDLMYLCVSDPLYRSDRFAAIREWALANRAGVFVLNPTTGYVEVKVKPHHQMTLNVDRRLDFTLRLAWRSADLNKRKRRRRKRIFL